MFIQIAARASESDESYLMIANYAEKLAEDVEKCLKNRSDPDIGNSLCSQRMYIQIYNLIKLKLIFTFIVVDASNNTSTSSEQNERLAKPKGMKVKEKTTRGSTKHLDIGNSIGSQGL